MNRLIVADVSQHLLEDRKFGFGSGHTVINDLNSSIPQYDSGRAATGVMPQPYGASTLYGPFSQHVKEFSGIFASDDISSARAKLGAKLATTMMLALSSA